MTIHLMPDQTITDTAKALGTWLETTYEDATGQLVSRATGSKTSHQTLHRSSNGRFYLVRWSNFHLPPSAKWLSDKEAIVWLLHHKHALPADLDQLVADTSE